MISDEQIERFFKRQCSSKEAEEVAAWLKSHPEAAATYMNEEGWQETSTDEGAPEELYNEVWQQIDKTISKKKSVTKALRYAVAACIILFATTAFLLFNRSEPVQTIAHVQQADSMKIIAAPDTEYNTSNHIRIIRMSDDSRVSLLPKSIIWFDTPFAKTKREIYLQGEARFEVTKNKEKPFIVYSGALSTTALGTEFIVKQVKSNIKVQLLHGKVVIKAVNSLTKNWKDVYLSPGQQMIYNHNSNTAQVSSIPGKKGNPPVQQARDNTPLRETPDSLIFNSCPMRTVINKLGDYYRINIQFSEQDIKEINFTGVISKRDPAENVLRIIMQMNALSVTETDTGFVIFKH